MKKIIQVKTENKKFSIVEVPKYQLSKLRGGGDADIVIEDMNDF